MPDMAIGTGQSKLPIRRRLGRPIVLVALACLAIVAGMMTRALLVSVPVEPAAGVALSDVPQGVTLHHIQGEDVWIDRSGEQLTVFRNDAHHLSGEGVVFCANQNVFMSPAHGELFDRHGVALDGPASRGLDRFPVSVELIDGSEEWSSIRQA